MTKLVVAVSVKGQLESYTAATEIPELLRECFAPVDLCDEPLLAMAVGGVTNKQMTLVIARRKDAANFIADCLTEMLLDSMKADDTRNGYRTQ